MGFSKHTMQVLRSTMGSAVLALSLVVLASGCGSEKSTKDMTAADHFAHAMELFKNEDYLEAITEFSVITMQYQGSAVAGDAQYYLAESRFKRAEYLLAAFEYQVLKRSYSSNPHVPEAQYKIALCYYRLSPKPNLDQQYTRKAIDEFQAFVEYYPKDSLASDASAKIHELTERLAKKQYDTARLYETMEYSRAALMSYDEVIEKYHDTEYAPLAYQGKVELLMSRRHYREAGQEIDRFLSRYPNSVLRAQMESLKKKSEQEVQLGNNVERAAPPQQIKPPETQQL